MNLTERICDQARDLGFDLAGVAPTHPAPRFDAYRAWLARGYHGEMGYLARPDRVERRGGPGQDFARRAFYHLRGVELLSRPPPRRHRA